MEQQEWVQFPATDELGVHYSLRAHRPLLNASSLSRTETVYGLIDRLETVDGMSVRRIDKGTYQIEATGVIVRSDDPAAP